MSIFRTSAGSEVDLVLEDGKNVFAIEIKSAKKVTSSDFRGLSQFAKFFGKPHRSLVVSMDPKSQEFREGHAIPIQSLWTHLEWNLND